VYTFTTVVTDTNVYAVNAQDLSATNSFTVTVNAIHNGPVLGVVSNQVVNELTLLTVTNAATDNDIPALPLTYTLAVTNALTGGVVTNASISTNGIISWTPTEAQGPSTNTFTTIVSDGSLSATNSFTVTVNEVNTAPTLPAQSNLTIDVLAPLVVTNTATDSDIPANTLNYQLTGPSGSTIDSNGVIRWTPLSARGGTTNFFITIVTDNGVPPLSATNSFEVMVNPAPVIPAPVIQSIAVSNGIATVTWSSVSNGIYRLQYVGDLGNTNWMDVSPDVQAGGPAVTATNITGSAVQQFYRIMVVPSP
jgi:molybdopterin-binding protein